jgi:RNA polymerase sigma-70 factor (ECF subfamily)
VRTWLYTIATNACLALIAQRPRRLLSTDVGPAGSPDAKLGAMQMEPIWLEPYPDDPQARVEQRESVELAFVAALQHLPANQRAALLVREVLGFSAAEAAAMLDATVGAVENALQRARKAVAERVPERSQQATLRDLGDEEQRTLVERFVGAWGRADVGALLALLASDARFTMPPIPTWFDGRDDIGRFFATRVFAAGPWRLEPMRASGQLAFACYQAPDYRLGALQVITLRGREIVGLSGFLDPAVHARFGLPDR